MTFFDRSFGYFELILVLLLLCIFYCATFMVPTDIPLHAQQISDYAYGQKALPANFLYYFTVYAATFFSPKLSAILVVAIYVLTAATMVKYGIVKRVLIQIMKADENSVRNASLFTCLLIFCFSLPSIMVSKGYYLLLSYPPNVWHNSTTIFVMPFVVSLFCLAVKQLNDFSIKRLLFIGLLIVANAIIKPSYLFVFLIAYPVLLLAKYRFSKVFWLNLIPLLLAVILIAVEYYFIYVGIEKTDHNSVAVLPFSFIKTWAADWNILVVLLFTMLSSFLFPVITLIRNPKLFKETDIQLALLGLVFALVIGNVFAEVGTRSSDGNFLWQNIMCSFLLFFAVLAQLVKLAAANPIGWKAYRVEVAFFLLHAVAGFVYFYKTITTYSYF